MTFKNPIGKCDFFATPENLDALELYIAKYSGTERIIATTIFGMTMNLCSAHIDGAIKEQEEADALEAAQLMKMDMIREGN